MARTITLANQKGGVGKTTTAINLGAALASLGKATLIVDLDPQGNATIGLGISRKEVTKSLYQVLLEEFPAKEAILTIKTNLFLLPSIIELAGAEIELVTMVSREYRLREALDDLTGAYDYILLDCPPSLGLLTINAMTAADSILIPIQCEFYALEGVTQLLSTINLVRRRLNPKLEVEGVLLTMSDGRTLLSQEVTKEVQAVFPKKVFEAIIPRSVRLAEAPSFGKSIFDYEPRSKGAAAYLALAKEVLENH